MVFCQLLILQKQPTLQHLPHVYLNYREECKLALHRNDNLLF